MVSERFSYQVVEVKSFFGAKAAVVQEKLVQLGLQGWELVSVVHGFDVRTLIAYGEHWYPWFMRRLAERPANVLFAVRNLIARRAPA